MQISSFTTISIVDEQSSNNEDIDFSYMPEQGLGYNLSEHDYALKPTTAYKVSSIITDGDDYFVKENKKTLSKVIDSISSDHSYSDNRSKEFEYE